MRDRRIGLQRAAERDAKSGSGLAADKYRRVRGELIGGLDHIGHNQLDGHTPLVTVSRAEIVLSGGVELVFIDEKQHEFGQD